MMNPGNCDVLLLAAGFGKRLGALTRDLPKPLIEVAGRKLIDRNLEYLSEQGFKTIFINLHYHPDKIKDYVKDGSRWNLKVNYSYEPLILDTGGAVKKIRDKIFSDRLLVFNSDIIIDREFSLKALLDFHCNRSEGNLATLVVREDPKSEEYGSLGVSEDNTIVKFLNFTTPKYNKLNSKGEFNFKLVMFTGISILEKRLLTKLPEVPVFSLTRDVFKPELERGSLLSAYLMDLYWCDAGTPERLVEAGTYLKSR